MQKAQGRPGHDRDRLESSGRQRKKRVEGLASSAKMSQWRGDGDCRMCSSPTLLQEALGGPLAREGDGERVKGSFSGERSRPARCRTGAKTNKQKTTQDAKLN